MEGDKTSGAPLTGDLIVVPDIAEVDATEAETPGPDRRQTLNHGEKNLACGQHPGAGVGRQIVEQMARTRTVRARAKVLGRVLDDGPEGPQQRRTTTQANERVVRGDLEGLGEPCFRDVLQASGIGLPWGIGPTRKKTTKERIKTG